MFLQPNAHKSTKLARDALELSIAGGSMTRPSAIHRCFSYTLFELLRRTGVVTAVGYFPSLESLNLYSLSLGTAGCINAS